MRDTQLPITREAEYQGYLAGCAKLTWLVEVRESRLIASLAAGDAILNEDRRFGLLHLLRDRQAIIDALHDYAQKQRRSA